MVNQHQAIIVTDKERAEIERMAEIGLRTAEISAIKGLATGTLEKHYQVEMTRGRKKGRQMLFQTAYRMATEEKHPAVLIFLLKTRCGLREKERMSLTIERKKKPRKIESLPVDVNQASKTYAEIMKE